VKLSLHLGRPTRTATVAVASAAAGIALAVPGMALAEHGGHAAHDVPAPPTSPTSAGQIQNIDQVKTAIKAYYGDTTTTVNDPVPDGQDAAVEGDTVTLPLHQFSPDSAYAHETEHIAKHAGHYLAKRAAHHKNGGKRAVVFDIDDTTLNTYSYEIYSNFVYNPTTNAYFVNAGSASVFPAVPGMVRLEHKAIRKGYTVFFLTGRPSTPGNDQTAGTLSNLKDAHYWVNPSHVFLKDATAASEPWLKSCVDTTTNPPTFTCNTIQYKSMTRQHIEKDLGYHIVANLGDQFSDLKGGFADRTFKIPNPMYYLP
jgi:predicted secreted acid phosphatase